MNNKAQDAVPVIPDHKMIKRIGEGAYGEVWIALNETLGQYRAIKVVYRSRFSDGLPFEREFAGVKKFEPISRKYLHLVNILHVVMSEDKLSFYYIMELADDINTSRDIQPDTYQPKSLSNLISKLRRLPLEECVDIAIALASALDCIHSEGLVHRDIKPSNIIFTHGTAKLADIGLVTSMTDAKTNVGTEGYISPEGPGNPQAEIFSLGKVLYEISTGKPSGSFPELPTDLDAIPERSMFLKFNKIIMKACANKPSERYQSAKAMKRDLLRLDDCLTDAAPEDLRTSKTSVSSLWVTIPALILAFIGLTAWGVPIYGFPITIFGIILAIKARNYRLRWLAGIAMWISIVCLGLTIANSTFGAVTGALVGADILPADWGKRLVEIWLDSPTNNVSVETGEKPVAPLQPDSNTNGLHSNIQKSVN